jgi:DNA-directed RNA polymerase subunit RPC12/RpoP
MAKLIIFNIGTKLEFGECSACGAAIEPETSSTHPMNYYPDECPECRSKFDRKKIAEEE